MYVDCKPFIAVNFKEILSNLTEDGDNRRYVTGKYEYCAVVHLLV